MDIPDMACTDIAGCALVVRDTADFPGDGPSGGQGPTYTERTCLVVGETSIGCVLRGNGNLEIRVGVGVERDGEVERPGVEGWGDGPVLDSGPGVGGRADRLVAGAGLGQRHGGQAQQRCCGGCEEGDFNVHNLLYLSSNEDGGSGGCRRGDICSLTELDCIYPEWYNRLCRVYNGYITVYVCLKSESRRDVQYPERYRRLRISSQFLDPYAQCCCPITYETTFGGFSEGRLLYG